jgi:membrane-anchored glycerophosphoryl diester phosphodiesterase (GDPDase)
VQDHVHPTPEHRGVYVHRFIPVVGGLFAFLVPGVYFLLKFALALPAAAVDGLDPMAALRRSFVTTDGHIERISTLLASFALVVLLSSVVVTLSVGGTGNRFLGPLVQNLATAVLVPIYGLAFGRVYPVSGDARS